MGMLNGDIVQVSFRGRCFGQRILLVRHYKLFGDAPVGQSTRTDLQNINTAVAAAGVNDIMTPYLACLPPQYTLESIRSQRIRNLRTAYEDLGTPGAVGTNVNNATVACDSAGIILRTFEAGRGERGTAKIGPAPDGASAAGLITAAYQALLSALGSKLVTAFVPVGWGGTLVTPVLFQVSTNTSRILQTFLIPTDSRVMNRRVVGRGE